MAPLHRHKSVGKSEPDNIEKPGPKPINPLMAPTGAAAGFVAQQVVASAVVACDASTCSALASSGFGGHRVHIGKSSTSLSNASLVIVTPEFLKLAASNSGLRADVAPVDLASWGSGSARVTVQVVDPSGGGAYMTAFNQARTKRTNVGGQLVNSGKVSGDTSELAAGAADPRLMLIIKALAGKWNR